MNIFFRRLLLTGLCLSAWVARAEPAAPAVAPTHPRCTVPAPPPVAPIPPSAFLGWTNTYRLQNEHVEAILVPALGRLVRFASREGESLFRLDPLLRGKSPAAGERFFNIGGDWLWPVAQARWAAFSDNGQDWPPPAPLADLPWECSAWVAADDAACALMTREYGAPLHILVSRLFRLDPGSDALVVQQRIERTAASDIPVVLWNISQIAQAEQIAMPVEKTSRFRGGLKALMGRKPSRRQLVACDGAAVYQVRSGAETKLGSDSPRGWIAAAKGTNLIFETVANTVAGDPPDGGCIVEVYSNQGLGYSEIETLSPEVALAPGTVIENTLRIGLATTGSPLKGCAFAEAVQALIGKP